MAAPPVHTDQRFTIRPTYIVSTPIYSGGNAIRSKAQRSAEANLKNRNHKGLLSYKASKKIRNAINWLVSSSEYKRIYSKAEKKHFWFKVNFITLTIPAQDNGDVTGETLHKLLHTWLVYARKYFYLRNYVWKIERGSLGKIHVHLTTDTFIHYRRLRDSWNRILLSNGLSDKYFEQHGHYDPNSTDVHATRNIKHLAGYLAEYMVKGTGLGEEYTNRIWGCNFSLSDRNKCSYIADSGELAEVGKSLMSSNIKWKKLESKPDSMGNVRAFGEIFFLDDDHWKLTIKGKLKTVFIDHITAIRLLTTKPPPGYLIIDDIVSKLPTTKRIITEKVIVPVPAVIPIERREPQYLLNLN